MRNKLAALRQSDLTWWMLSALLVLCFALLITNEHERSTPPKQQTADQQINKLAAITDYIFPPVPVAPLPTTPDITQSVANEQTQVTKESISTDDLSSINIRIDLPSSAIQRRKVGQYLYQCVGVGFGALKPSEEGNDVVLIHPNKDTASTILRRVNHSLFENETHWKAANGGQQDFVRVYPQWFDLRLLHHINANLDGDVIKSFFARYQIHNRLLLLKDIEINDKYIAQVWTMSNGFDRGC